jgi:hypothetical protein
MTQTQQIAVRPHVTASPVWTARCKSGFEFPRVVKGWLGRRKVAYKPCQRVAGRGMLMCADCLAGERVS